MKLAKDEKEFLNESALITFEPLEFGAKLISPATNICIELLAHFLFSVYLPS